MTVARNCIKLPRLRMMRSSRAAEGDVSGDWHQYSVSGAYRPVFLTSNILSGGYTSAAHANPTKLPMSAP